MQAGLTKHTLRVESPAFGANRPIPTKFTPDGDDIAPPLRWETPPVETQSVAIVVDDPDAPRGTFTHWVVTGIPPSVTSIDGKLPAGAIAGENDYGDTRWHGPKPPSGCHRYCFKVYALDMPLAKDLDREQLLAAIGGHVLAQGELVGTCERH